MEGAWVYILRCSDGLYYVGSHRGDDPISRVWEHNQGVDPAAFTFKRRPVKLAWAGHFDRILDAIAFERQLKGWSRVKKEAVIEGRWSDLPALAQTRGVRTVSAVERLVLRQAQHEGDVADEGAG